MTIKGRLLIACAAAVLSLGAAELTPAAAENVSAHAMTKTMRHHRPMMMHRHTMRRPMMHRHRMMHRSM